MASEGGVWSQTIKIYFLFFFQYVTFIPSPANSNRNRNTPSFWQITCFNKPYSSSSSLFENMGMESHIITPHVMPACSTNEKAMNAVFNKSHRSPNFTRLFFKPSSIFLSFFQPTNSSFPTLCLQCPFDQTDWESVKNTEPVALRVIWRTTRPLYTKPLHSWAILLSLFPSSFPIRVLSAVF